MPTHTAAVEMASMSTTCCITLGSLSYLSSFRLFRRRTVVHFGSARREDTMHPPTLPEAPSTAAANLPMTAAKFALWFSLGGGAVYYCCVLLCLESFREAVRVQYAGGAMGQWQSASFGAFKLQTDRKNPSTSVYTGVVYCSTSSIIRRSTFDFFLCIGGHTID